MKKLLEKISLAKEGDTNAVKSFFYVMVGVIVFSIGWSVLSSTVFKKKYKRPHAVASANPISPLSNSFNGAISSATNLMEIRDITAGIDSLMVKGTLTKADSIQLMQAFNRLEILHKQTN